MRINNQERKTVRSETWQTTSQDGLLDPRSVDDEIRSEQQRFSLHSTHRSTKAKWFFLAVILLIIGGASVILLIVRSAYTFVASKQSERLSFPIENGSTTGNINVYIRVPARNGACRRFRFPVVR